MPRETTPIVIDDHGAETHPSFGMLRAARVSGSVTLFDSEIVHQHYVVVELHTATRKREINHDWIHPRKQVVSVAMSEAQWASFVSSMNTTGVPCTIEALPDDHMIPAAPFEPRLKQSVDYATSAADEMYDKVRERFERVKEKPTKANLRDLEIALDQVGANVGYAAKTLAEHVENVVVKARADIETMVARHAETLGIEAGSYTAPLELTAGEDQ